MTGELIGFTSKKELLAKAERFWNPGKTRFWTQSGVPLVIGRREGYVLHDVDGKRLIDMHLNGGTYNLGHRNPEIVAAVTQAMAYFDIGNHHFPSVARTALAQALVATAPEGIAKVMFGSSGGEAMDLALKSARHATGRRRIVSVIKAYHGHTGLAVGAATSGSRGCSSPTGRTSSLTCRSTTSTRWTALATGDVAAVIMETIPATYGFPLPAPGYLEAVKDLCERHGALYIADEVQTGLMRTGELWGITKHGVAPDLLVTGKGISGGMYPVTAVLATERAAAWTEADGFAQMSTFGGAEVGCIAALHCLEITTRPEVRAMSHHIAALFTQGLDRIRAKYPDWFTGVRQDGLVMGLEFAHPEGAKFVMRRLYTRGVWAIFSTLDPHVLQYKPGLLLDPATCDEILEKTDPAIGEAHEDAAADTSKKPAPAITLTTRPPSPPRPSAFPADPAARVGA